MTRVFISGGTGFIAIHIIDLLLEHGHSVVTSVRSQQKGENILKHHPNTPKSKLDFVIVEDIAKADAFDEAIKSDPPFEVVLHTSSPFHFNAKDIKKDLLDPAIIGTTGILKAIKESAPTVKRVVITSSFAAIINPGQGSWPSHTYSEKDWNPITAEEAIANPQVGYRGSKTLAEKAAWDFVEQEKPSFTLSTLCPPLVLGPIVPYLQNDIENLNTSNQRIAAILTGKAKNEVPPTGTFIWTDVRELALAHVKAAELEDAGGKRFFITAGHFSNNEIVEIIRDAYPNLEDKLPVKDAPSGRYPEGGVYNFDNSRSKEVLGLKYRSLKESVLDTVKSLQEIGA